LSISTGTLAQAKEFIFGSVVPYDTLGSITDATGFTRFDIGASYAIGSWNIRSLTLRAA
jgi:hypothetical protein